jgi:hypothetical protein
MIHPFRKSMKIHIFLPLPINYSHMLYKHL